MALVNHASLIMEDLPIQIKDLYFPTAEYGYHGEL
jgi:hypothetical protein